MAMPVAARVRSLTKNEPQDVAAFGAECQTNRYFLATLYHGPREHGGEADGGQRECGD
jgi:hypothetical protein